MGVQKPLSGLIKNILICVLKINQRLKSLEQHERASGELPI